MIHRNADQASALRKSGRGRPCRHRYKVTALNEYGVRVSPIEGAPEVLEWQPLHKIGKAFPKYNDDEFEHYLNDEGMVYVPGHEPERSQLPGHTPLDEPEEGGQPPLEDGTYEVEEIMAAERRGKSWWVLVKWMGWNKPTWEARADILDDCTPEVKRGVYDACARFRMGELVTGTTEAESETGNQESGDGGLDGNLE